MTDPEQLLDDIQAFEEEIALYDDLLKGGSDPKLERLKAEAQLALDNARAQKAAVEAVFGGWA